MLWTACVSKRFPSLLYLRDRGQSNRRCRQGLHREIPLFCTISGFVLEKVDTLKAPECFSATAARIFRVENPSSSISVRPSRGSPAAFWAMSQCTQWNVRAVPWRMWSSASKRDRGCTQAWHCCDRDCKQPARACVV